MWRSSKIHVSGELQLPPQEECFSWLIFSSIEEYFYKKQHATCMDHAHQIIRSLRNDTNRRESISGTFQVLYPPDQPFYVSTLILQGQGVHAFP